MNETSHAAIVPEQSPFLPRNLAHLFVRPSEFFSSALSLRHLPNILLVTWCLGATSAIDRLDSSLFKAEFGRPRPGWDQIAPYVVDSWAGLWLWLLIGGAIGGAFYWWLGRWWFRLRVKWAGAVEPDRRTARLIMIYSAFVYSAPAVAFLLVKTILYPSYAIAYASEDVWPLLFLVFPFWSIVTSNVGVQTVYDVVPSRARLWFVFLPSLWYVAALGILALLIGWLQTQCMTP